MTQASLRQFSATRLSNVDLGGGTVQENQMYPSGVNNAFRELMGQIAENIVEMSYPTAGGTANALTLTPTTALAALASNVVYTFKAASANTAAATMNVSGLGIKAIRKISGGSDIDVIAGDLQIYSRYVVVYDTGANAAAGAWVLVGIPAAVTVVRTQVFTGSGTYTPNANMLYCTIEAQGGGGGGGGTIGGTTQVNNAGGGGAGAYSRSVKSAAAIGVSQVVTIGALGAGGATGANAGSTGGTTSVGALVTAPGGFGSGAGGSSGGPGGAGGNAGTADVAAVGGSGQPAGGTPVAGTPIMPSGNGANSQFGSGGIGPRASGNAVNGAAGAGYGSGGSGGTSNGVVTTASGGAGTAGIVIITEYCSA